MASKAQLEERAARREARAARMAGYVTLRDVANALNIEYERARELVVVEERIPYVTTGSGGKSSPKYLVRRGDLESFKRVERPMGRPRIGDRARALRSKTLWRAMYGASSPVPVPTVPSSGRKRDDEGSAEMAAITSIYAD